MGTRLPRNFAEDPVNGAYGDEEDRLAQAIGDAVNGPGGPSSGTSAATISSGIDQSANSTATRTAAENLSTKIDSIDTNVNDIEDSVGKLGDAPTANTIVGILKSLRASFSSLLTSLGTEVGDLLEEIRDGTGGIETSGINLNTAVGEITDSPTVNPTTDGSLIGTLKGFWTDTANKLDQLINSSNGKVEITPISHDVSIAPNTTTTLLAATSEQFNILRVEISVDTPCFVEVSLGTLSVVKFFNADLITLPFEEFGFLSNGSASDLTVTVRETASNVRLTGTTWYEATGAFI